MTKKLPKSDEEWKEILSPEQYHVCREKGTEPAFSGAYYDCKQKGTYCCVCCGTELFASGSKFDSGTGWPSFWAPHSKDSLKENSDLSHGMVRTEVVCQTCDAHLGHVFPDGPEPTNLRFCINSVSLKLKPENDDE